MKFALGSNLIFSTGYRSTRLKTHVAKVLDAHFSSYVVQYQKTDGALRIFYKNYYCFLKRTDCRITWLNVRDI